MTASTLPMPSFTRILIAESRSELLKAIRLPAYFIPSLLFPAMFYIVFGLSFGGGSIPGMNTTMAAYLIATYGTFGVVGAAMFGLGVGVAIERGQGWLTLKRASPMPPLAYFGAKVVLSILFATTIALLLMVLGYFFGHVRLPLSGWLMLLPTLAFGAIPFCALGCAIGYLVGPNSAPALTNLLYLPMSLASGLWIPVEVLPKFIQHIAPFLPPYHLARLSLRAIGATGSSPLVHIGALAGFTVLFLAGAVIGYRRDDGRTYG